MNRSICLALVSTSFLACGPGRQASWEKDAAQEMKGPSQAQKSPDEAASEGSLDSLAESHWEQRGERAELEKAIAIWEKIIEERGEHGPTLVMLSRGYYLLGDGYMRLAGEKDAMLTTLEKGVEYGERAMMAMSPSFAEKVRAEEKVEDAVSVMGKEGMPAVYWYSSNLGKFAAEKGFTTQLFYKDRIVAVMGRVLELDPTFFHAAPHRYFGAFYAKAPSFAGGDMAKSKQHFETSISMAPEYLGTKVLFAEYYAVKEDDRELFTRLIDEVVAADAKAEPSLVAENTIEQRKAKALKAKVDEFF